MVHPRRCGSPHQLILHSPLLHPSWTDHSSWTVRSQDSFSSALAPNLFMYVFPLVIITCYHCMLCMFSFVCVYHVCFTMSGVFEPPHVVHVSIVNYIGKIGVNRVARSIFSIKQHCFLPQKHWNLWVLHVSEWGKCTYIWFTLKKCYKTLHIFSIMLRASFQWM